jgi:hypothetical protein
MNHDDAYMTNFQCGGIVNLRSEGYGQSLEINAGMRCGSIKTVLVCQICQANKVTAGYGLEARVVPFCGITNQHGSERRLNFANSPPNRVSEMLSKILLTTQWVAVGPQRSDYGSSYDDCDPAL